MARIAKTLRPMPGWVNCRTCGALTERFTENECETCIGKNLIGSVTTGEAPHGTHIQTPRNR